MKLKNIEELKKNLNCYQANGGLIRICVSDIMPFFIGSVDVDELHFVILLFF